MKYLYFRQLYSNATLHCLICTQFTHELCSKRISCMHSTSHYPPDGHVLCMREVYSVNQSITQQRDSQQHLINLLLTAHFNCYFKGYQTHLPCKVCLNLNTKQSSARLHFCATLKSMLRQMQTTNEPHCWLCAKCCILFSMPIV